MRFLVVLAPCFISTLCLASQNSNELKRRLFEFQADFFSKQTHVLNKRASCDDGKGNYGINSFNFLAFTLLTFNVISNVNNNLNSNNNNKNDNNINAISQNANNVATNTNVGNSIGVTVLPIPGKRSIQLWQSIMLAQGQGNGSQCHLEDKVASLLFYRLQTLKEILEKTSNQECQAHEICQSIANTIEHLHFDDAVVMGLAAAREIPFLSMTKCQNLFRFCGLKI